MPQALSHPPQCTALELVSTHRPPHSEPVAHAHAPLVHVAPGGQTLPQPPQSRGFVERSTQEPAQFVFGGAQVAAQAPFSQSCPLPQATPHPPQSVGLAERSTHRPPQLVEPTGHAQTPATHCMPPEQVMPHAPQSFGSLDGSAQPPLHATSGKGHSEVQVPA